MRFYLGTHQPCHLSRTDVPLFLSRRRLAGRRSLPRARGIWALDSGGFTELSLFGCWTVDATQYVKEVRRFTEEIGSLVWASPMDWMCEPWVIGKTGLSVAEHQRRTVDNFCELRSLAPELPWVPVLQGWTLDEYRACIELYASAGVDLRAEPLVGVGSVCRRQHGGEAAGILASLALSGIRLHAYGVKLKGLERSADVLTSADSMAWSAGARRAPALAGCTHKNCANCLRFALRWRASVLRRIQGVGLNLFTPEVLYAA
jgi:hypothetical protein